MKKLVIFLTVLISILIVGPASAQVSPFDPNQLNYEGTELVAVRAYYHTDMIRQGMIMLNTTALDFDTIAHAETAFDDLTTNFVNYWNIETSGDSVPVVNDISAPKVGDERSAQSMTVVDGGTQLQATVFYVRHGEVVSFWVGLGLFDPTSELMSTIESFFDNEPSPATALAGTPEAHAALLGWLPDLDDVPPGFTLLIEQVGTSDG
jgi:hypothetical protein